jgi:hypothetical protein
VDEHDKKSLDTIKYHSILEDLICKLFEQICKLVPFPLYFHHLNMFDIHFYFSTLVQNIGLWFGLVYGV